MEADFTHALSAGAAGLPELLDRLESELAVRGAPAAVASSVLIAADEVISNIVNYGGGAPSIAITAGVAQGRITVCIVDDGVAFDPLQAEAPDTTLSVEAREIGGLGIHLVRRLMDHVTYERRGNHNRLQFSKSFDPPSPSRQNADGAS